jgi:replicative DNA helicase
MFNAILAAPEFEHAVITVCLQSHEARERTHFLSVGDFANVANGTLWATIQELHAKGDDVDAMTVGELLSRRGQLDAVGGMDALANFTNANGDYRASSARTYAHRVRRAAFGRQTLQVGAALGALAPQALELGEDDFRAEYNRVVQDGLPVPILSLAQTVGAGIDALFENMANPLDVVPMRIQSCNVAAAGGMAAMLYPGMLSTIIGASGEGKTAWLTQIAEDMARLGARVAIVDGEMPHHLANARRLQRYSGVPADKQIEQMYVSEQVLKPDDWRRLERARDEIAPWANNIDYLYAPGLSIYAVVDELRELHRQRKGLHLVILDYIQLFSAGDQDKNKAQNIGWAVQLFKNFCGQTQAHGYMGSQFSNEAIRQEIRTQYGAKESGDIGAKSNCVITIQRPIANTRERRVFPMTEQEVFINAGEMDILATFRIDKNSFGQSGRITKMIFDGPRYRWLDFAQNGAGAQK